MECRELAMKLLQECGCQEKVYAGGKREEVVRELEAYQQQHNCKMENDVKEIAECLIQIGNEAYQREREADLNDESTPAFVLKQKYGSKEDQFADIPGYDQAKWGVADLYEEYRNKLQELLLSGKDFRVCGGAQKEITCFEIQAIGKWIIVSVRDEIDELSDIIWNSIGEYQQAGKTMTEDEIQELHDNLYEDMAECYEEGHEETVKLARQITLEELCDKMEEMEHSCMEASEEHYLWLKRAIKEEIEYIKEPNQE